ncbi:quinone oxidoreductase family protein [Sorangium sp. So ce1335]|uniref:quinone oxidoreductase family protein n=1 Tax=Sorangium sp. So ce1335 TaxID=3133335 RepID=UPI003F620E3C
MKAIGIHRHGDASQLVRLELPEPEPGPHQVRVRVIASSVNPADIRARSVAPGPRRIERRFPVVLGYDVSGTVDAVGPGVDGLAVGDEVFGSPSLFGQGANAELVVVDSRTLARKPAALSHEQAACLSLAGVTAWECLARAQPAAGATVLVTAGAGGVGHLQVQLARHLGLRVVATASRPESTALCRELGAAVVLDHAAQDVGQACRDLTGGAGVAAAFDNAGGRALDQALDAVAPLGAVVSIVPTPAPVPVEDRLFMKAASLVYHVMGAASIWRIDPHAQGRALAAVAALAAQGHVRPVIAASHPVRELALAHRAIESGRTIGKIAIRVADGW